MFPRGPVALRSGLLLLPVVTLLALMNPAVDQLIAQSNAAAGKKYAFLVGVEVYEHASLRELKYAGDDVAELAAALGKSGYETIVLTAETGARDAKLLPTKTNIEAQLRDVLRECKSSDLILLGFAGHGLQFAGSPDAFFCPLDARPFSDETSSMVSMSTIYTELEKSFAGVKIMLVDACRDDPNPSRGRGIDADSAPPPPRGVAALFSCSSGQRAFESDELKHGVFFHHVLRGLEGEAANRRGEVTFDSLSSHVRDQVPRDVARLVPGQRQFPNLKADLVGVPPVLARVAIAPAVVPEPVNPAPLVRPPSGGSPAGPRRPSYKATKNSVEMTLEFIPDGEFVMGSSAEEIDKFIAEDSNAKRTTYEDELPPHGVIIIRPFYLGIHEVTQTQYKLIMGTNPSHFSDGGEGQDKVAGRDTSQFPVEMVSWIDAIEFCNRLSAKEGRPEYYQIGEQERDLQANPVTTVKIAGGNGYRLPTEAEWEYACRANTTTLYHFGNQSDGKEANVDGNYPLGTPAKGPYLERSEQVGSYPANAFGLFDMHGNVWEWCFDGYAKNFYEGLSDRLHNPINQRALKLRVMRGGSWYDAARTTRSAYRSNDGRDVRKNTYGFRVARNASN